MGRSKQKPTSRISIYERQNLASMIENILARHQLAFPCPISADDLVALWRSTMSDINRIFWDAARNRALAGYLSPFIEPLSQGVLLEFDFGKLLLKIPDLMFNDNKLPIWNRKAEMEFVDPHEVLGPKKYAELSDWAKVAVHIHTRVEMTKTVLTRIVRLASTVGQLKRMAPELVKYTATQTQEAFGGQERRSPLPDEWMKIDRMLVRCSLDHLTFCYLLPKIEDQPRKADELPWIWDQVGAYCADHNSRPAQEKHAQLSKYTLPFDSNPMELGKFTRAE